MPLRLEKEMYREARMKGLTFTELLAQERPSEVAGLDAFEFSLMERDINLRTATVERFYRTKEDIILFPEFINRNVRIGIAGLTRFDVTLDDLIATTTTIDSGVYDTVNAQFDSKKVDFTRVAEGAPFPTVSITSGKNTIRLGKIGLRLNATYEVLRRMKLPLMAIHLQLIGKRLAKRMVAFAMYSIVNGDGNANGAPATAATALSYNALLDFFLDFDEYEGTVMAAKASDMKSILHLAEFQTPLLFDTARTGNVPPAFGLPLKRFNWTETTLGAKLVTIIDKSAALELIKESGSELIETDKVIDQQFENTVISQVIGFSRIFTNAAKIFTIQ